MRCSSQRLCPLALAVHRWAEKREATKRSYGWGGYEPVWCLSFLPAAIASVYNAPTPQADAPDLEPPPPVSVEGAGVVLGCAPVAEEAGVSTYTLVRKGVSSRATSCAPAFCSFASYRLCATSSCVPAFPLALRPVVLVREKPHVPCRQVAARG